MNRGLTIYTKWKLELCYEAGKDGYTITISFLESLSIRVVLLGDVSFVSLIHQIVIVMVGHKQLHFFVFYEIMEIELCGVFGLSLSAIQRHLFDASKRKWTISFP